MHHFIAAVFKLSERVCTAVSMCGGEAKELHTSWALLCVCSPMESSAGFPKYQNKKKSDCKPTPRLGSRNWKWVAVAFFLHSNVWRALQRFPQGPPPHPTRAHCCDKQAKCSPCHPRQQCNPGDCVAAFHPSLPLKGFQAGALLHPSFFKNLCFIGLKLSKMFLNIITWLSAI